MTRRDRGRWKEHRTARADRAATPATSFPRHEARELARFGRQRPCRSLASLWSSAGSRSLHEISVSPALCELHRGVSLRSAVRRLQNEPAFHAARSLWPSRRLPVIDWPLDLAAYIRGPSPALPRVCRVAMPRVRAYYRPFYDVGLTPAVVALQSALYGFWRLLGPQYPGFAAL